MSQATHQIDSMDPQKNNTDELQVIRPIRSMEHTQELSDDCHVFCVCWVWVSSRQILVCFG